MCAALKGWTLYNKSQIISPTRQPEISQSSWQQMPHWPSPDPQLSGFLPRCICNIYCVMDKNNLMYVARIWQCREIGLGQEESDVIIIRAAYPALVGRHIQSRSKSLQPSVVPKPPENDVKMSVASHRRHLVLTKATSSEKYGLHITTYFATYFATFYLQYGWCDARGICLHDQADHV